MLRKLTFTILVALLAVNPALAAAMPCAVWAKLLSRSCCCEVVETVQRSCCDEVPDAGPAGPCEEIARDARGCDCEAAPSDDARTARELTVRFESSAASITWIEAGERISARALVPFDPAHAPACTSSPPDACRARFLPNVADPADLLTAIRIALL
ncbi:MAG: hypothetical protein ACKVWV_15200 [Planctomycetota bacterium]